MCGEKRVDVDPVELMDALYSELNVILTILNNTCDRLEFQANTISQWMNDDGERSISIWFLCFFG